MTPCFRKSMIAALGFFVLAGAEFLKGNASADLPSGLTAGGELGAGVDYWATRGAASEHGAKVALGNNANAVLSLDLIASGGAGNQRDDGVATGAVSGRGTKIALEIFATGVSTSLRGVILRFAFDASLLSFVKAENSAFPLSIPEESIGVNLAATSPVALARSGFLARAEFETVADVTSREFFIGIESVTLAESPTLSDVLRTSSEVTFNTVSSPDFDGDSRVGFSDFLIFAEHFGTRQGDGQYVARIDLDGDGAIGFSDFLIFAEAFGAVVDTPSGFAPADQAAFDRLAVGKRILLETFFLDVVSAGRFTEGFRRHEGSYAYANTGANTAQLTQTYDNSQLFGGRCTTRLTFTSPTMGAGRFACDNGATGETENWRLSDLATPLFLGAAPDTLYFAFRDTWRAGQTRAYDLQLREKTPQGHWNDVCVTYSNRSENAITAYARPWIYSPALTPNTTYEFRYRYRNSSSCDTGSPGPWSPIVEGTIAAGGQGSGDGGGGGGGGRPDLVVDAPTVSNSTPTAGASFTLGATVRNQGDAPSNASTLRYYTSSDATITTSDTQVGTDALGRLDPAGTSEQSIGLTAPSSAGTYYYGACVDAVARESDTGNNCSAAVRIRVSTAPPPATGTSKLYWTDWGTDKIQRADLDGSNVEDVVSDAGLDGPDGLSLDRSSGKIYWTNVGSNKIQRANLDGSNVEDLITSGLSVPYGLALDAAGGKMYWTNRQTGKIQRADLDGSNVEDLLILSGLAFPGELALDVSAGKMYWTNPGSDKIQRANLDGANVEDVVTGGLSSPTGLALDLSGGKIYWTDRGTHKIQRADLDGANVEDLVTSGLNTPTGLDLDVSGGKIYWTDVDANKIQRANLDGSNVEDLLTRSHGLVDPSGLAVGVIRPDTGGGGGTPPPSGDAITGSITECTATLEGSIYRVRITGTVQAVRPVSSLTLRGYVGSSFVGMASLGSMSAGQTKRFTITGISSTEPGGGCRVNMEWREGGGNSQAVVNER